MEVLQNHFDTREKTKPYMISYSSQTSIMNAGNNKFKDPLKWSSNVSPCQTFEIDLLSSTEKMNWIIVLNYKLIQHSIHVCNWKLWISIIIMPHALFVNKLNINPKCSILLSFDSSRSSCDYWMFIIPIAKFHPFFKTFLRKPVSSYIWKYLV